MFIGAIINFVVPLLGVNKPISSTTVIIALFISTIILTTAAQLRIGPDTSSRLSAAKHKLDFKTLNEFLLFIILPIISILGALLVNAQNNNTVLLIMLPAIILIPVLIGFNKIIPKSMLPVAVISIALALLLHQTLISQYLTGWDIHEEYYYQGLVIANGHWQWSIPANINGMLSITLLCPIYSFVLKIDGLWVLKVIYPILFALVPLTLFEVYKPYWGAKRAFVAAFIFMSVSAFFTDMLSLGRQEIAEIFLSLLLLLLIDKKLKQISKSALALFFMTSLVVSHYGLTYLTIALFGTAWLLLLFSKTAIFRKMYPGLFRKRIHADLNTETKSSKAGFKPNIVIWYLLLYLIAFTLIWYIFISSGTSFNSLVGIWNTLYSKLVDFTSLNAREPLIGTALGLDWRQVSALGKIFRLLQYCIELSIVLSLATMICTRRLTTRKFEYQLLAIASGLLLMVSIVVPYLSAYLNATRIFQISLIFLAPFCVLGLEYLFNIMVRTVKLISPNFAQYLLGSAFRYLFILIILVPYFLFNTGFVFEITKTPYSSGQIPTSMALSGYREDFTNYNYDEAQAAEWLVQNSNPQLSIYGDIYSQLLLEDYLYARVDLLPTDVTLIASANYVYLRPWNIEKNEMILPTRTNVNIQTNNEINLNNVPGLNQTLNSKNLVYNSGNVQILGP
jgi:uncharacterized membrane protein